MFRRSWDDILGCSISLLKLVEIPHRICTFDLTYGRGYKWELELIRKHTYLDGVNG